MWDRRASIVDVHDGDTVTAVLDQGFGDTKEIKVRLLGVYAPELRQNGGIETRAFVARWLDETAVAGADFPYIITTARTVRSDIEQSTLGRYVATVTNHDGTRSLNAEVMEFVAARRYAGGTGS